MNRADWRNPAAYEELRSLDAPGFAWEYLRRNLDFQRHRAELETAARHGPLTAADADAFAGRWGVRFRECCRYNRSAICCMDSECPSDGHSSDGAAG